MDSGNFRDAYLRAEREKPALGVASGRRPEPTLDEARTELAQAISRVLHNVFQDRYGPLVGAVSEPTINEILKSFEANLARAKGDITLVAQELLDRAMPPMSRKRK
jgi:NifB/MoaA-like Fe-S oxidoreductase